MLLIWHREATPISLTHDGLFYLCRDVWPSVPILLCAFHVKQAWATNLQRKTTKGPHQQEMIKDLDDLMRFNVPSIPLYPHNAAAGRISAFLQKHEASSPAFVSYFRETWSSRPGWHESTAEAKSR